MAEVALRFPFSLDPNTGSIVSTSDQATIWNNRVRMALETLVGERVMRPTYGVDISKAVFNTLTNMEDTVRRETSKLFIEQFPLLELIDVTTTQNIKENTLIAEIRYLLPNKTEQTTAAGVMVVSNANPPYEELSK
jgi:phage baseplate assembly protein W